MAEQVIECGHPIGDFTWNGIDGPRVFCYECARVRYPRTPIVEETPSDDWTAIVDGQVTCVRCDPVPTRAGTDQPENQSPIAAAHVRRDHLEDHLTNFLRELDEAREKVRGYERVK